MKNGDTGVPETCASCHQPLVRQGNQGACAHCLVRFAVSPGDDAFGEETAGDFASLGSRRYGHFEILTHPDGSSVELGRGAMGITYQAQDTVLRRTVALKVIDGSVAQHPAARARFLSEARTAAQFQHPNVAAVSHYGEQAGECFYAMELVEGETLEARVRREGPLSVSLALEVAVQVTRALVAARARGVIHRDLKPTNLMLTLEEAHADAFVVKVIDFGLAKALNTATNTNPTYETRGAFVGTPAFASPEQFSHPGECRIDDRSDIYSLGATLWYALVGHVPFHGESLEEIRVRQQEPLPLRMLTSREIPRPVVILLSSMLSVEPTNRPQSARELLDELRRCREERQPSVTPSHRKQTWWWTVAALCTVLGLIAVVISQRHRQPNPLPAERSVAVLPFENLSTQADDAFFTTGVQDQITISLARAADLKIIDPNSTKSYLPGKRDLAAIGRDLGITHLLEGKARREGDMMNISLRLVDLRAPDQPWTKEYQRRIADVFAVQGEIARAVLQQLQVSLTPAEKVAVNRPPTQDLAAYHLFLRAVHGSKVSTDPKTRLRDKQEVVTLLDQAIARDPSFLRAYCLLASTHDYLWGHWDKEAMGDPPADYRVLAEIALQKAQRLQPDDEEVHTTRGYHFLMLHETEQAAIEADAVCQLRPNNSSAQHLAGIIAIGSSQLEKAAHSLEHAAALNPRNTMIHWQLAEVYGSQRRGEDCEREYDKVIALAPVSEKLEFIYSRATIPVESRADLGPLRAFNASLSDANDPKGAFRFKVGVTLKLFERDAEGVSLHLAADGVDAFLDDEQFCVKEWFEAQVAMLRKDHDAARVALTTARARMEKSVAADPDNGRKLSQLAMIDAGLGRKDEAVREAVRACELCSYEKDGSEAPMVHCNLVIVYAWTGQTDLAFSELEKAANLPAGNGMIFAPTFGDLRLNPIWDELRNDPRFERVVQKLAPGWVP